MFKGKRMIEIYKKLRSVFFTPFVEVEEIKEAKKTIIM